LSSFRIRRNLLRRRHVRKEQKQKNAERSIQQRQQILLEEQKQGEQVERMMILEMNRKRQLDEEGVTVKETTEGQARIEMGAAHQQDDDIPFRSVMNTPLPISKAHHKLTSSHIMVDSMGTIQMNHHPATSSIFESVISMPTKSVMVADYHNNNNKTKSTMQTDGWATTLFRSPQFILPERPNKLRKLRHHRII
jgi:hypothetical protein